MRSNQIFGVAVVALSLGVLSIGSALAATPTLNFRNAAELKSLVPAQAGVSGLALMANNDTTTPQGFAARAVAGSNINLSARAANLHAAALAMRYTSGRGSAKPSQAALDVMGLGTPKQSKGLAELKAGAGLPSVTPPATRQLALAAAKLRSGDSVRLLSSAAR